MKLCLAPMLLLVSVGANADTTVAMSLVDAKGVGASVGHVTISQSEFGLVFSPSLNGLQPGVHGFHLHENPSCAAAEKDGKLTPAAAAGGHFDPKKSGRHDSPWGDGHLGDLPAIYVDAQGNATQPVLAPRLKMADLVGRSLIVHAGGDNHADHPAPLGGGGARMACGMVKTD